MFLNQGGCLLLNKLDLWSKWIKQKTKIHIKQSLVMNYVHRKKHLIAPNMYNNDKSFKA